RAPAAPRPDRRRGPRRRRAREPCAAGCARRPGPLSRARLLERVSQLAFQLLDAPLELVDPRRELGHLGMRRAEATAGGVGEPAEPLLEPLDDPAPPCLEVPQRLLTSRFQLVPHLAHIRADLGARLPCEGLGLATELAEESLAFAADAFDGCPHVRQ